MRCRHCAANLSHQFLDLGSAPPSNAYLQPEQLNTPETWFPLRVLYCDTCWLVQTEDYADRALLFDENYAYFSSMSSTWMRHAERYAQRITERYSLDGGSKVVEVASNDGYLLRHFKAAGIPVLGIEPTRTCAEVSRGLGIETIGEFFGRELALSLRADGHSADLMAANNVLAHVPDINDFVAGFANLLKANGVATFEFPHLLRQVAGHQFDTVYHEHFSYLSLTVVTTIFHANGLDIFDVEELSTHGGSLRVFAQRSDSGRHNKSLEVARILAQEQSAGICSHEFYDSFQAIAETIKNDFMSFLIEAKRSGKSVAAYGAAAKGNTLINFAGVRADLISFVVDKSPQKLGRYLPGSRIPVVQESEIGKARPDIVIILPWNITEEVVAQLSYIREWGGQFAVAVPQLEVF
jgi:SAM-dependent methyltransferase